MIIPEWKKLPIFLFIAIFIISCLFTFCYQNTPYKYTYSVYTVLRSTYIYSAKTHPTSTSIYSCRRRYRYEYENCTNSSNIAN